MLFYRILVFNLIILVFYSCSSSLSNTDWVGQWEVTSYEVHSTRLSPALIEGAAAEEKSSVYTFHKDGSFLLDVSANREHVKGNWKFDEEAKSIQLVFLYEEGDSTEDLYQVERLESGQIKLSQTMGNLGDLEMIIAKKTP